MITSCMTSCISRAWHLLGRSTGLSISASFFLSYFTEISTQPFFESPTDPGLLLLLLLQLWVSEEVNCCDGLLSSIGAMSMLALRSAVGVVNSIVLKSNYEVVECTDVSDPIRLLCLSSASRLFMHNESKQKERERQIRFDVQN